MMIASTTRRLRMGVMGCADIAWRRTIPAMLAEGVVDLVAIASRDKRRAVEFTERFGGDPIEGYESLLDRVDVDAVYIPLPARLHAEWIGRALVDVPSIHSDAVRRWGRERRARGST